MVKRPDTQLKMKTVQFMIDSLVIVHGRFCLSITPECPCSSMRLMCSDLHSLSTIGSRISSCQFSVLTSIINMLLLTSWTSQGLPSHSGGGGGWGQGEGGGCLHAWIKFQEFITQFLWWVRRHCLFPTSCIATERKGKEKKPEYHGNCCRLTNRSYPCDRISISVIKGGRGEALCALSYTFAHNRSHLPCLENSPTTSSTTLSKLHTEDNVTLFELCCGPRAPANPPHHCVHRYVPSPHFSLALRRNLWAKIIRNGHVSCTFDTVLFFSRHWLFPDLQWEPQEMLKGGDRHLNYGGHL